MSCKRYLSLLITFPTWLQVIPSILLDVVGALLYISGASQPGRQEVVDHGGIELASTALQVNDFFVCYLFKIDFKTTILLTIYCSGMGWPKM